MAAEAHGNLALARETGVPTAAAKAMLPAVGCGRYLDALENFNFNLFEPVSGAPQMLAACWIGLV